LETRVKLSQIKIGSLYSKITLTYLLRYFNFEQIQLTCWGIARGSFQAGSGVRRKFSWRWASYQWNRVVICIWCALFVSSQF